MIMESMAVQCLIAAHLGITGTSTRTSTRTRSFSDEVHALQMSGFRINLKPLPSALPVPEEEEYYSSWSLFLVCVLLVLSLWTSYYLQIKKIKTVHETLVSIFAGMVVGLIVRLAPGTMIRDMLVSI